MSFGGSNLKRRPAQEQGSAKQTKSLNLYIRSAGQFLFLKHIFGKLINVYSSSFADSVRENK